MALAVGVLQVLLAFFGDGDTFHAEGSKLEKP